MRDYYELVKPGIIYGNALTMLAGFFLAARGTILWVLLFTTLFGLSFIIGSACVFNNILDSDIDKKMERTKNRSIVQGKVSKIEAMIFGLILFVLGVFFLEHSSGAALLSAMIGFFIYVFVYTPAKRKSEFSTLIGTIAGAMPIVVGYVAVTNTFDIATILLFFILVFWQMAHFYSIGIFRHDDYREAGIPILPVKRGSEMAKIHIIIYVFLLFIATELLYVLGYAKNFYAISVGVLVLFWLGFGLTGFRKGIEEKKWARKMFFISLFVIMGFSVSVSISSFLL